jgi:hypothetical protein
MNILKSNHKRHRWLPFAIEKMGHNLYFQSKPCYKTS